MNATRTLAFATYGEITRRPLYYIVLLMAAVFLFFSKDLTLFQFHQELPLVREMGMATLTVWAFTVVAILSGTIVTLELEDRTAVTLLTKPLRRSDFLLGKFAGLALALIPGLIFLAGVLFLTLWFMALPQLPVDDRLVAENLRRGQGAFSTMFEVIWKEFVLRQGGGVLQGAFLSYLQGILLAAMAVSLSAFFPIVVSVATMVVLFVTGNISGYMVASVDRMDSLLLTAGARFLACLLPNLGYFNLQSAFSEGRIASLEYLGLASVYVVLYVSLVFLVSCSLFRKREVR